MVKKGKNKIKKKNEFIGYLFIIGDEETFCY